jgi:hypothetical protein
MSSAYVLQQEYAPLQRRVKQLINDDLKKILRQENMGVVGVKAVLQERILSSM